MEPFTNFIEKMKIDKRIRTPFYDDNADYNTNSKSYYDDLARKAKVIELLTQRVWEYDEELRKRFERWDKLMDEFPQVAEQLFREWLRNGTIEAIIREELEDFKDEVRELIDDIDEYINGFDIREKEPIFINGFGGIRNAVNQSINVDYETNCIYTTQSDSKKPEGFWINKLSPSGKLLSYMWIKEGGHGTTIGLDRRSNGMLKIWFFHQGLNKLVQLGYTDNKFLSLEEAKNLTDYTPKSVIEGYSPLMDHWNDKLILRFFNGRVEVRSRNDVYNHIDKIEHVVNIDEKEFSDKRPMQGIAVHGNDLYWLSGTSSLSNEIGIQKYDIEKNKLIFTHRFQLTYEKGYNLPQDDFKEPEGLFLHVNPFNNKKTLMFGMTVGGISKRYNMLYGFMQVGAKNHWDSMTDLGKQNYKLTKDDGRTLSIPNGITSLKQLTDTGYYYLESGFVDLIEDFPYPSEVEGWFLEISPKNQTLGFMQKLSRFSLGKKILILVRSVTHNRDKDEYSFGLWTVIDTKSYHQEYLHSEMWNNKLSNVIFPGEYYMSSNQMDNFNDSPSEFKKVGCWLKVTTGDTVNNVRQEITTNTSTYLGKSFRTVNYETKVPDFDWVTYYPIPE